jgi:predicted metal-dependent hydrolase
MLADMSEITVRKMDFSFPEHLDPVVVEGSPEESFSLIGLSLLLPHLEPYLIRTMKVAKKQITDEKLIDDLDRFSAQEGHHFRQHIRFNQALDLERFPRLPELEVKLADDYRRFSAEKSLRFNLAYAEGFEALTTAFAHFSFKMGVNPAMHPDVSELMSWHLIEELEHRTVAFDVYKYISGSYAYRLVFGTYAQWHMGRFIARVTNYMLEVDTEAVERCGGVEGMKQRNRMRGAMARRNLLPNLLKTYLPWYTPHDIAFTGEMQMLAARYSEQALETR